MSKYKKRHIFLFPRKLTGVPLTNMVSFVGVDPFIKFLDLCFTFVRYVGLVTHMSKQDFLQCVECITDKWGGA